MDLEEDELQLQAEEQMNKLKAMLKIFLDKYYAKPYILELKNQIN